MSDSPAQSDVVLETRDMHMAFGGLVIFERMNFALRRGERHAIIGPNGAGKTTFVSLVTGLLQPKSGAVLFQGRDITKLSPQQRVKAGMVRTFQINSLFRALNPLESVVLALLEREGKAQLSVRHVAAEKAADRRGDGAAASVRPGPRCLCADGGPALWQAAPAGNCARPGAAAKAAVAR